MFHYLLYCGGTKITVNSTLGMPEYFFLSSRFYTYKMVALVKVAGLWVEIQNTHSVIEKKLGGIKIEYFENVVNSMCLTLHTTEI